MSVLTEQVADHMFVKTKAGRGRVASGAKDVVNSESTQHVSMLNANHVSLAVIVHAVNQVAGEAFDVILEQSNDRSGWFPVDQTTTPSPREPYTSVRAPENWEFGDVSMAWVRVVFLIDSATSQPPAWTGDATFSCTLTTSLK